MGASLDKSWELARLARRNDELVRDNIRLRTDVLNARGIASPYEYRGDLYCGGCDEDLGNVEDGYAAEYRFCPYCGTKLEEAVADDVV
ncbi:MAG: hypothetical protein J6S36_03735 [Eggerthellaceae bacterium]|nr:hypothetical protein [Eggerthellaceae bacterium]